jgi:hypothetical protein
MLYRHAYARCCRFAIAILALASAGATAQSAGQEEKQNMALVGQHDLQGRSAYQPLVHRQGARWIAYIGLHGDYLPNALTGKPEHNGTAILDVTDPKQPKLIAHIAGEPGKAEAGGAQMVRVCNGSELPHADKSKVYLLRPFGNSAQEVWDVTDPAKPALVTTIVAKLGGTHKNWWECDTGIAYLVSGLPDWRTRRMTQIFDLSNPAKPVFIRNFGLPGQQPGATGPVPTELHGPVSTGPKGKRVYFGYGTNKGGIVHRRSQLLMTERADQRELLIRRWAGSTSRRNRAHTVPGSGDGSVSSQHRCRVRDFIVTNESLTNECQEAAKVWIRT